MFHSVEHHVPPAPGPKHRSSMCLLDETEYGRYIIKYDVVIRTRIIHKHDHFLALLGHMTTTQTLDSDKSGGLDSQEFCAAIRKLVAPPPPSSSPLISISLSHFFSTLSLHLFRLYFLLLDCFSVCLPSS